MGEKRILDAATRKVLLGYVPFSIDAKIDYTPEEFSAIKDESLWPIFQLRSLTQAEKTQLKINYLAYNPDAKQEETDQLIEKNRVIARVCILSWSSLFDAGTGEEITYSEENKSKIPEWIIFKILDFIKKISLISAPEDTSLK